MEKTENIVVIPTDVGWSDVGSWESVYSILRKDKKRQCNQRGCFPCRFNNSMGLSLDEKTVAAIGVSDIFVIESGDAILVLKKGHGQKIKDVVEELKKKNSTLILTKSHLKEKRPWGEFKELEKGDRYKIKRITVKPGESLSLQMRYHRSEHWVVVKGERPR